MLLLAMTVLPSAVGAADKESKDSSAQTQSPDAGSPASTRKSLRLGSLTIDPEVRIESDWARSDPATRARAVTAFGLSGKRVGIEGALGTRLTFDLSAELATSSPWRNAWVSYRLPAGLSVTGGQFKVPFSHDGTLSVRDRALISRSRLADAFTMGRDQGVTVEARAWRKRVTVEGGFFAHDGNRLASDTRVGGGARHTTVARAVLAPFARRKGALKSLRAGINVASSRLAEGRSNLTLSTVTGHELTSPLYWAEGRRRRTGFDLHWQPGPFSLAAEFLTVADERRGQGNGNDDLPPLTGAGWFLEGTWFPTGEPKARAVSPARPLLRGGPGAIELVGRVERVSLGVRGMSPALAGSPRALHTASSHIAATTAGINWYPASSVRLQVNVIHESIQGATTRDLAAVSRVTTTAVRFQVFL